MDRVEENKHDVATNLSREDQPSDSEKRESILNSEVRTELVVKSEDVVHCEEIAIEGKIQEEVVPSTEPIPQEESLSKNHSEALLSESEIFDDVCEEKKKLLKDLTQNCLGILFSLRNGMFYSDSQVEKSSFSLIFFNILIYFNISIYAEFRQN